MQPDWFVPLPIPQLWLATILHFTWQAILIAASVAVGRTLLHPRRFHLRYLVSVTGLIALLAAPLCTLTFYVLHPESLIATASGGPVAPHHVDRAFASAVELGWLASSFQITFRWFESYRFWWLGGWAVGILILISRLGISFWHCQRLRRTRQALPPRIQKLADQLQKKMAISRRVMIATSGEVAQAIATGVIRPVVLIPAAWVTQLPLPALEAILAHELAHIKRYDLWINLLQRLAETLFFFHPLVWWISRSITAEREVCCDQMAIRVTGKPLPYVEALAHVAGLPKNFKPGFRSGSARFGTAFDGGKKMNLLRRAKMILEPASMDVAVGVRLTTMLLGSVLVASTRILRLLCVGRDPAPRLRRNRRKNLKS